MDLGVNWLRSLEKFNNMAIVRDKFAFFFNNFLYSSYSRIQTFSSRHNVKL